MENLSGIKLNFQKLEGYDIISEAVSRIKLKVAGAVGEKNYYNPAAYGESGTPRYIVSLKAFTADNAQKAFEMLSEAEGNELPIEDFKNMFLTGTIWDNDGKLSTELPTRGCEVICNIDWVEGRDGSEVLRITDLTTPKAKVNTNKFSFEKMLARANQTEEVSEDAVVEHD
jgi:hypothetical protein